MFSMIFLHLRQITKHFLISLRLENCWKIMSNISVGIASIFKKTRGYFLVWVFCFEKRLNITARILIWYWICFFMVFTWNRRPLPLKNFHYPPNITSFVTNHTIWQHLIEGNFKNLVVLYFEWKFFIHTYLFLISGFIALLVALKIWNKFGVILSHCNTLVD